MKLRRLIGALAGVAISVLIAAGEARWGPLERDLFIADSVGLTGIPIAALLGWRFTSRVGKWNAFGIVAWMGISAVLLGNLLVSVVAAVMATGDLGALFFAYILFGYGLFLAVILLPVTLVAAAVWWLVMLVLVRGIASRPTTGTLGAI
jgi:hypothetical protein